MSVNMGLINLTTNLTNRSRSIDRQNWKEVMRNERSGGRTLTRSERTYERILAGIRPISKDTSVRPILGTTRERQIGLSLFILVNTSVQPQNISL